MSHKNKLSSPEHWSNRWQKICINSLEFNPQRLNFKDLHHLFMKTLPRDQKLSFLEIGCYPGSYMWYFNKFFGYKVSGIEYIEWCCQEAQKLLYSSGVKGEVIHGDIFTYKFMSSQRLWDVVASFGFLEHFNNTVDVVQKHLDLVKPGGFLVLVIPNHQGVYGDILRIVSPEKYKIHNRMTYEDMLDAINIIGNVEFLQGGYYGHIGFWNSSIYAYVRAKGRFPYLLVRSPLWLLEQIGQIFPNTAYLSPNAAIVVKKVN